MRKLIVGAAVAALLVVLPGVGQAAEPCPARVADAQAEFDAAVKAGEDRLIELGATQENVNKLLALVGDNELSEADQAEARRIYEASGFVYNWSLDTPGDLAKLNRILDAASELDAARKAGCEVPKDEAPAKDPDLSQIGKVPSGSVETGSA